FRVIERAIRRAGWNVEFTEGFTKRMKLSLGPPLPLGYISRAEYFDLEFKIPPSDSQIERLNESLPEGFKILEYMPIVGKIDSLFSAIDVAHYIIHLPKDICISGNDLLSILNMDSIIIKRREKEIDIRPLILKLNLISPSKISALLRISEKRTARPDEILLSMGFERERIAETIFERTELLKEEYDGFYTPMGKLWEINNYA
ncbi:MAG: TIGR03936 family radical SAM-associated protein, partial [bacterium]